jgi:predicted porin
MKKSLIALAALAAVSAASAQSTVTISGGFGLAFGKSTLGTADSGLQIARQTGNLQFAGSEDLGGGLKAGFQLQSSIGAVATTTTDVSTASNRTILGDRGANVTLSGGFGGLFLGRGNTAIRSLWGSIGDVTGLPVVSGISDGSLAAGDTKSRVIYGDTFSNYIAYATPNVSGFTANLALAPTQDTSGTGIGDTDAYKDTTSLTLQYANGPLAAGVNITDVAATGGAKLTTLLASYDLGVAKVGVTTQSIDLNDGSTNPGNGTVFTVSAPLGSGVAAAGFGKRSAETSAVGDDVKQTFVGYKYMFSKRTAVSAVYNKIDRAGTAYDLKETHLIVGHTF